MKKLYFALALLLAGTACNRAAEPEQTSPGAAEAYTAAIPSAEADRQSVREAEARGKAEAKIDFDRQESEERARVADQKAR